jgi:long-chain acyl-CoA synthetase
MAILEAFGKMGIFVPEEDRTVAWLPLPHVFGRFIILSAIYTANTWSYAGEIDSLIDDLGDIQPTVFHSVPRIYEKIYQKMTSDMAQASPVKRVLFGSCTKIGSEVSRRRQEKRPIPFFLRAKYAIAERIVFRRLRDLFGGRIRLAITGGAPLSKEILEFFHAAGILILEAYGLTESPSAAFNRPDDFRFGTVGRAVPGMEIRIAEDGEILLRSPIVFAGYLKDPEKTKEAFRDDGWYCTGDIGVMSPDGFVKITDRKKDIIITAGGKNVAPQNIENLLKTSPMISQVMVYGDRKPYLTALITLDPEALGAWGEDEGLEGADLSELYRDKRLRERIAEIVKEKSRNLASFETIKKFEILPHDFALESGEITPTLKVKRRFVSEKYRDLLENMYG